MEFDELLTQPKWQILELIAKSPNSPVKISEEINTSVAYVSQQLKLLEAVGLIKKHRTKESVKGKPRLIYSISEDIFYITALVDKFPKKKKITPNLRQKVVLKIWLLESNDLSYYTEKLFWKLENILDEIEDISIDEKRFKIYVTSKNSSIKTIVQNFTSETSGSVDVEILPKISKKTESLYSVYSASLNDTEEESQ